MDNSEGVLLLLEILAWDKKGIAFVGFSQNTVMVRLRSIALEGDLVGFGAFCAIPTYDGIPSLHAYTRVLTIAHIVLLFRLMLC